MPWRSSVVGQDVERLELDARQRQHLDHLGREAALREDRRALHVEHDRIGLDVVLDAGQHGSRSVIVGSSGTALRSVRHGGGQRQGVQLAAHAPAQRPVDHLVLLDPALAAKGRRHHVRPVVIAVARQILDRSPPRPAAPRGSAARSPRPSSPSLAIHSLKLDRAGRGHERRQPAFVSPGELAQAYGIAATERQRAAAGGADPRAPARPRGARCREQRLQPLRRDRQQVAALVLAEQPAGIAAPAAPRGRRRCRTASTISASATARPPSARSWQASTCAGGDQRRARARRGGARSPDRPAAARPPRGRRPRADRAMRRASRSSRRSGSGRRPARRQAGVAMRSRSSISPRPPIVGVGRIAWPSVSL